MRTPSALLVLAILLSALLRLAGLGHPPLSSTEAAGAWLAWTSARVLEVSAPVDPSAAGSSALLSSLQWLLFVFGGDGEGTVRLPEALFGMALLLAPWIVRGTIGSGTAAALALLAATDPVLVAASRHAEGGAASVGLAALWAACAWRSARDPSPLVAGRWRLAAGVAAGLLLVSGIQAWALLPLLLAACLHPSVREVVAQRGFARALAGAALAGATAFLAAPVLAGAVSASLTRWIASWGGPRPGLAEVALAVVRDQPLLLVLGLAGLAAAWRDRGRALVLTLAVAWGSTQDALVRTAVLFVAAGWGCAALPRATGRSRVPVFAALAVLLVFQAGSAGRAVLASTGSSTPWRRLAADVRRLARERAGDERELPVLVADRGPVPLLGWTLRDMRDVRFGSGTDGAGAGVVPPLLLTPQGEDPPAGYVGTTYEVASGGPDGGSAVVLWVSLER
jgi:hypothetical protein